MRRYWIPIAPIAQLLDDPVRKVRVLGEDLVLFRDLQGKLGLIGERCAHRAVELRWGIPDDHGLRCPYHGWLYGAEGQCLDTPLEDPRSTFKERINVGGYPVQELGGLVFAYLGPKPAPLLPPWDLFVAPNTIRQIGISVLNCNWLQCQENTGDPTHSVWLHGHLFKYILEKMGNIEERAGDQAHHTLYSRIKTGIGIKGLYARATQYGLEKGIEYSKELGADEDKISRHGTVIFPFYTQTGMAGAPRSEFQIRVPIDDTHTYHIAYQAYAGPPEIEVPEQEVVPYYECPIYDEKGKPILDYVLAQDMIAWWSQGEIVDRSKEKLGRTDIPVIFLRRQLDEQIRIVEQGGEPMNVFRDPSAMDSMLHGAGVPPQAMPALSPQLAGVSNFRAMYHRGFNQDDGDRYGPAMPLVQALHRRIEELQTSRAGR
jgi:5,5'-dehydrodivanillate O-demethylase